MEPQKRYEILRLEDLQHDGFWPCSLQIMKCHSDDVGGDRIPIPIVLHDFRSLPDVMELFIDIEPSPFRFLPNVPCLIEPSPTPGSYIEILQERLPSHPEIGGVPAVYNFTVDQRHLERLAEVLYQVWSAQIARPIDDNPNRNRWNTWVVLATLQLERNVFSRRKAKIFFNREESEILSTAMADLFAKNSMAVEVLGLPRRPQPPQA
jgi:hypothetical protein